MKINYTKKGKATSKDVQGIRYKGTYYAADSTDVAIEMRPVMEVKAGRLESVKASNEKGVCVMDNITRTLYVPDNASMILKRNALFVQVSGEGKQARLRIEQGNAVAVCAIDRNFIPIEVKEGTNNLKRKVRLVA